MTEVRRSLLVVAFAILGVWLLVPGRNVVGNPRLETLQRECHAPEGGVFRLYVGDAGAMVAPWFTVTYQSSGAGREQQIFNSFRRPVIDSLRCDPESVLLSSREGDVRLSYARVHTELVRQPLLYYDRQVDDQAIQPLRVLAIISGLGSLFTAGLLALRWVRARAAVTCA